MKRERTQDLRNLEDNIYNAVEQCIVDAADNANVCIFIDPKDCDILVVVDPVKEGEALFAYESIDWQNLVLNGKPDVDAINEVASGYIFVN